METEQHHYELRSSSRSRSQTPLVQNRALLEPESVEHHYDLRNRSRERSHTPGEVTSSRRSGSRSLPGSSSKAHDRTMGTINENREEALEEINPEDQNKQNDNIALISTKKAERRSERQKAKRQILANGQGETKDDISNSKFEQKRRSITPHRVLNSDYSFDEDEQDDQTDDPPSRPGSVYEFYKQAGDWWNKFPKTDYTYSRNSQYRYEVAPGILAIPNMSRRSLHSDGSSTISNVPSTSQQNLSQSSEGIVESGEGNSIESMDDKNLLQQTRTSTDGSFELPSSIHSSNSMTRSKLFEKTHIKHYASYREIIYTEPTQTTSDFRQRYLPQSSFHISKSHDTQKYDSDVELDEAVPVASSKNVKKLKAVQWLQNFNTIIVAWYLKVFEFLKLSILRRNDYRSSFLRQYNRETRWRRLWHFVNVLLLDSWLLSRLFNVRRRIQKRGRQILWIVILSLLFLAENRYVSKKSQSRHIDSKVARGLKWEKDRRRIYRRNELFNLRQHGHSYNRFHQNSCWSLPYVLSLSSMITTMTDNIKVGSPNIQTAAFEDKDDIKVSSLNDNLNFIIETLNTRNENVEKKNTYQTNKIQDLRSEIDAVKRELIALRAMCNDINIQAQVENTIAGYFGSNTPKTDVSDIIEKMKLFIDKKASILNASDGEVKEEIREIVNEMLKTYDADKTGRVDYALETAGGQIISTRCTQKYYVKSRAFKLLGLTLCYGDNNPQTVIQGNPVQPGVCWSFQDFPGYLLIKLRNFIYVTGFTIEHAAKSILPNGEMKSAPRKFNIWGLIDENDPEPTMFGDYEFVNSDNSLQYFPVQNTSITVPYEYVELRIHSNHGNLDYTCLYRFRVHGKSA